MSSYPPEHSHWTADPLVSVVIVTWNRRVDVLQTIQSVRDQDYQNVEIIVVDNGSSDGTAQALAQVHTDVTLVALDHNQGAAGGRNHGLSIAGGEIIFLLDSDASLGAATLPTVVERFKQSPEVGIITCKIVSHATGQLDSWIFAASKQAWQDQEFPSYSCAEGGCAIRRQVLERIGYFWNELFFGREGEEFCLRAWDAGFQVLYCPEAIVYHRRSSDTPVHQDRRLYFDLRNSLFIYVTRYPWWMLAAFVPLKIGSAVIKGARRGCLKPTLRALVEVAQALPGLLQQRQPLNKDTAFRYVELQRDQGALSWNLRGWLRYKA